MEKVIPTSSSVAFTFSKEFQESMLALMLIDPSFAEKVVKVIPEERLYSDSHKYLFKSIGESIELNQRPPTFLEIEDASKKIEITKRKIILRFIKQVFAHKVTDAEFIKERVTEYARKNLFVFVFQNAQTLWNTGKFDDAYDFVKDGIGDLHGISLKDDANVSIAEFENIRGLYATEITTSKRKIPTIIPPLDQILKGGLEKGELGIILAEAKKGKSQSLVHFGVAGLFHGFKVAHFVLEGMTQQSILRYQARLSMIDYNKLESDSITKEEAWRLKRISEKHKDNLMLIPFNQHWNYTVMDVEAKIRELERQGNKPDLVIIDYADLLRHHEKSKEKRFEQTEVYRDLKRVAMMRNVAIWTASQARRPEEGPEKEYLLRAKDISESYEKVRIADFIATLNQTPKEKEYGIVRLHADIYRSNDTDKTIKLVTDFGKSMLYSPKYGIIESTPEWSKKGKK